MFKLTFETDNAAFEDNHRMAEIATILRKIADRLDNYSNAVDGLDWKVYDSNGNHIGNLYLDAIEED